MILPMTAPQLRAVALGLALSAAGGFGLVALASAHTAERPPGPPPAGLHGGMGPGMPLGMMSPQLLDGIEATPQQREQLQAIADAARADLKAQHDAGRSDHEQMLALLTQPSIDAKAVEALRKQTMARQDTVSKRMTQTLLQSAQVLTLEQRQKMAALIAQHADRMPPAPHARADIDGPAPR